MTVDKVVDASALAAIAFVEDRAQQMERRLRGSRLFAPALLRFEMAHVCVKKIRQRPAETNLIVAQLQASLRIDILTPDIDPVEVVALAEQHALTAYDASYLWLAFKLGVELVSGDKKLVEAALRP